MILLDHLHNIELTNYFKYQPIFNGVSCRTNLSRIKDGTSFISLDDKNGKEMHWVSFFIDRNTDLYFDSFVVADIPQEVFKKIRDKSITHNIFRIQDNEYLINGI